MRQRHISPLATPKRTFPAAQHHLPPQLGRCLRCARMRVRRHHGPRGSL